MKKNALSDLRTLLNTEKEWVKVHVAEFLLWEGAYVDDVRDVFLKEEQLFGNVPKYRIGIWRVLAQAATTSKEREAWQQKICAAYLDTAGNDRIHAIESLAKLGVSPYGTHQEVMDADMKSLGSLGLYARWAASHNNDTMADEAVRYLVRVIQTETTPDDALSRQIASYIVRYLGVESLKQWSFIRDAALQSSSDTALYANLLATTWISAPKETNEESLSEMKEALIDLRQKPAAIQQLLAALAAKGEADDFQLVTALYKGACDRASDSYNADIHASAAYALLRVLSRL